MNGAVPSTPFRRLSSEIIQKLATFNRRHRDAAIAFDLVDAGEADASGQFIGIQVAPIAGQDFGGIGFKNDPALPTFQMSAAVVVQIDPMGVENLEEQGARGRSDFAKVLDVYPAFS